MPNLPLQVNEKATCSGWVDVKLPQSKSFCKFFAKLEEQKILLFSKEEKANRVSPYTRLEQQEIIVNAEACGVHRQITMIVRHKSGNKIFEKWENKRCFTKMAFETDKVDDSISLTSVSTVMKKNYTTVLGKNPAVATICINYMSGKGGKVKIRSRTPAENENWFQKIHAASFVKVSSSQGIPPGRLFATKTQCATDAQRRQRRFSSFIPVSSSGNFSGQQFAIETQCGTDSERRLRRLSSMTPISSTGNFCGQQFEMEAQCKADSERRLRRFSSMTPISSTGNFCGQQFEIEAQCGTDSERRLRRFSSMTPISSTGNVCGQRFEMEAQGESDTQRRQRRYPCVSNAKERLLFPSSTESSRDRGTSAASSTESVKEGASSSSSFVEAYHSDEITKKEPIYEDMRLYKSISTPEKNENDDIYSTIEHVYSTDIA